MSWLECQNLVNNSSLSTVCLSPEVFVPSQLKTRNDILLSDSTNISGTIFQESTDLLKFFPPLRSLESQPPSSHVRLAVPLLPSHNLVCHAPLTPSSSQPPPHQQPSRQTPQKKSM
ncbi:hypothetical protein E2C01_005485 [Portunus trituberculatus]|uniref:Uncharacterized protein n=1 Tax=Portunus trituberculatus TaxID=210409 RepID=A0A5B7CSK6_PORTR|nr:hypothetical protein [Portunus trituberculatus]